MTDSNTAMNRRLSILLAFALVFSLVLSGCANMVDFDSTQVFAEWSSMESGALSRLLIETDKDGNVVDSAETVARIVKIMDALGVEDVTIEAGDADITSSAAFTSIVAQEVTITYTSSLFDPFSFEACANFTRMDEDWRLIWDWNLLFPQMQKSDSVNFTALTASRGEIFTSDRVRAAGNTYAPTLYVRPEAIEDQNATANALSDICGVSADEILSAMTSEKAERDSVAIIRTYSPAQDISGVRAAIAQMPGVGIDESYMSPMRIYPLGDEACLLSNLVGYVGAIPEEKLSEYEQNGYGAYDTVGLTGLEAAYESTLRGKSGYVLSLVDESGNTRVTLARRDAQNGADLTLTIDSQMQLAAERALREKLANGQSGSMISIDPTTGAVLTMASAPTYDNNFFTLPAADEASYQAQWDAINSEDGGHPLLFRCIQGLYTPGSTAKTLTAAAVLETGTLSASDVFPGVISNNTWTPQRSDWYYPGIVRHSSYSGPVNMTNALMYSDNIYFAYAAMQLGAEKYVDEMTKFGFFDKVPFELNVYNTQISSSDDRTKVENIKFLADLGYGQGEMLSTPMQMAVIYSALANNGTIMQPYVVAHIDRTQNGENVRVSTTEPTVWKENVFSAAAISTIVPMLRGVVQSGTATSLDISGLGIAGKTGTAETGVNRQHSWFIGFTTEGDDPRLACVTLDVRSRQGGAVQPLAKVLFTAQRSMTSTDDQTAAKNSTITPGGDDVQ